MSENEDNKKRDEVLKRMREKKHEQNKEFFKRNKVKIDKEKYGIGRK